MDGVAPALHAAVQDVGVVASGGPDGEAGGAKRQLLALGEVAVELGRRGAALVVRVRGLGARAEDERDGDQRKLTTATASTTRPKATASFQRGASPSQSQAKTTKTTSVMTSCAIFSCAAVNWP